MNITEIVQSQGWKNFMKYLYGIGAAVVILGALFKIMHWPGDTVMIIAGLGTEAIIFIFSSFEPLHEELDWTLVYPELAGMSDPDEMEHFKEVPEMTDRPIAKIEDLIGETGINADSMKQLSDGFSKLNETAANLSDITEASVATKDYMTNMKSVSEALGSLNETYSSTSQSFKDSLGQLSESYLNTASKISESGSDIAASYDQLAKKLQEEQNSMSQGNVTYNENISSLNDKLTALNSAYELQLQSTNEHLKESTEYYKGIGSMVTSLKDSVEETSKIHGEISKLSTAISDLNSIYGNMLSSMSSVKK
jgi:gliding motility-associated protein GldL